MGNYVYGSAQSETEFGYKRKKETCLHKDTFELYEGCSNYDETQTVSLLFFSPKKSPTLVILAANGLSRLKMTLHHGVVKHLASVETPENLVIATEHILPLASVLKTLSYEEIVLGLYQLTTTLQFLHEMGKVAHCNLSLAAVFVNPNESADWKLGGFEFAHGLDNEKDLAALQDSYSLQNPQAIPPEYVIDENNKEDYKDRFNGVPLNVKLSARDMWALGNFVSAVLAHIPDDEKDSLQPIVLSLKNADPFKRMTAAKILAHSVFSDNELIHISEFLRNNTLYNPDKRKEFFLNLYSSLKDIAPETVVRAVVPRLLKYQVMIDTEIQYFLPHFFTPRHAPGGLLPKAEYEQHVATFIIWALSQQNRHLRISVMKAVKYYIPHLSAQQRASVHQQIVRGIMDSDEAHIEESTIAMLCYYQSTSPIENQFLPTVTQAVQLASSSANPRVRSIALQFLTSLLSLDIRFKLPMIHISPLILIFQVSLQYLDTHPDHLRLTQDSLLFGVALARHLSSVQAMDMLKKMCDLLLHPNESVREVARECISRLSSYLSRMSSSTTHADHQHPPTPSSVTTSPIKLVTPITDVHISSNGHSPQVARPVTIVSAPTLTTPTVPAVATKPIALVTEPVSPAVAKHKPTEEFEEQKTAWEARKPKSESEDEWDDWNTLEDRTLPVITKVSTTLTTTTLTTAKRRDYLATSSSSSDEDHAPRNATKEKENVLVANDFFDDDMAVAVTPTFVTDVKPPPVPFKPTRLSSLQDDDDDTDILGGGEGWGDEEGEGWGDEEGLGDDEGKDKGRDIKKPEAVKPMAEKTSFNFEEDDEVEAKEVRTRKPEVVKPVVETSFHFDEDEEEEPKRAPAKLVAKQASLNFDEDDREEKNPLSSGSTVEKTANAEEDKSEPQKSAIAKIDDFNFDDDDDSA